MIAHLKDQLQETKAKTSMETKYIKKDAEVRTTFAITLLSRKMSYISLVDLLRFCMAPSTITMTVVDSLVSRTPTQYKSYQTEIKLQSIQVSCALPHGLTLKAEQH